jgi:hypothetical protein
MKDPATMVSACELILEGLVAKKRITIKEELGYARVPTERKPPFGPGQGGFGTQTFA